MTSKRQQRGRHPADAPNSMHVVVAWATSRPSLSRSRASVVAVVPPGWTTVTIARYLCPFSLSSAISLLKSAGEPTIVESRDT